MKVLMVASECAPFIKTGGLADVVGALPGALSAHGIECKTILPAYRALKPLLQKGKRVATLRDVPGGPVKIVQVTSEGMDLLLLDAPGLFDREGLPYTGPDGKDWPDNHIRFGALGKAAAVVAQKGADGWVPDILHAHDWQAALAPVYLKQSKKPGCKSIITIHNIAFQGRYGPQVMGELGLRGDWFHPEGLEFHGDLSFLKGGLVYSDLITTVSPNYAREILTPVFGMGLEGVLQHRSDVLSGILNGIDTEIWDPSTDPAIGQNYDARSVGRKSKSRAAIARRLGLDPKARGPLFCVISRLTTQKGLDALVGAIPALVAKGGQLAVLGSGEGWLEAAYKNAAKANPGKVGVLIGYDEDFAHLLQAGSDAILIPSRFEPCGLTQLYGVRYGTIPVVARTGGLADTIVDANVAAMSMGSATGFVFDDVSPEGISRALDRVFEAHADAKSWRAMQRTAMSQPVGWEQSASAYGVLYRSLLA